MTLSSQRHFFDMPDEIAYLNCAYMSPLLNAARDAGQAAVARKSRPWRITAPDFFEDSETARSNFALLPIAIVGLRQLLVWGVAEIAATLGELTGAIETRASEVGLQPVPAARRVRHMLGLRSPAPLPAELPTRLAAANVYVSVPGQSIRISPHLYNTTDDVERLFAVLATAL
jgi:selenocysteine lyase/cysteine desulfurase